MANAIKKISIERGYDVTRYVLACFGGAGAEISGQNIPADRITVKRKAHVKYEGTDSTLAVDFGGVAEIVAAFEEAHRQQFGCVASGKPLVVEAISVEAIGATEEVVTARRRRPRLNDIDLA